MATKTTAKTKVEAQVTGLATRMEGQECPVGFTGKYAVPVFLEWLRRGASIHGGYGTRKLRDTGIPKGLSSSAKKNLEAARSETERLMGLTQYLKETSQDAHLALPEEWREVLGDVWQEGEDGSRVLLRTKFIKPTTLGGFIRDVAPIQADGSWLTEEERFVRVRDTLFDALYRTRLGLVHLFCHAGIEIKAHEVYEFFVDRPYPQPATESAAPTLAGEQGEYLDYVRGELEAERDPVGLSEWRETIVAAAKEAAKEAAIEEYVDRKTTEFIAGDGKATDLVRLIPEWQQEAVSQFES